MSVIESLEREQLATTSPSSRPATPCKVHFRVIEGTRQRVQVFEGNVHQAAGLHRRETFTVRKQSFGVGVERTFPVHSPKIERIERVWRATSTAPSSTTCAARSGRRPASARSSAT